MSPPLILTWTNAMNSKASLNETTAIHSVSTGHGQTVEWYDVQNTVPTDSYCYDRNLSSFDGFIQSDMTKGSTSKCIYPQGLYFCEYDVCGEYTGSASAPIQKRTRRDADDSKTSLGDRVSFADGSYMFMPINNDVNPHTEVALSDVPMYGAVFKYSVSGIQDAVRDLSHGMDSSMRVTDNGKIDLSDLVSVSPSQRVSKQTATYDYTAISELLAANPKTQSITSKILKRINNAQTNNNGKSFINSHSLSIGRNSKSVYMNLNN